MMTNMKITRENKSPRKRTAIDRASICSKMGRVNLIGKNPRVVEIFVE